MRRASSRSTADRLSVAAARATIESVNDQPMMQEVGVKLLHDEQTQILEHFHPYGFTAVPQAPQDKKKAEAVVMFLNGSRSHGLVIVTGDRRYRLKNGKPGEVALHDDQGQVVHLTRDGIVISTSKTCQITSGDTMTLKAPTIVLDGTVKLGGSDASKPASMKGTVDSGGNSDVSDLATKVLMK